MMLLRNKVQQKNNKHASFAICLCSSVANLAVFPRIWAYFLWTCGLLVFGLVLLEICLFFGLVVCRFLFCGLLFSNFMALLLFQYTVKGILGAFL